MIRALRGTPTLALAAFALLAAPAARAASNAAAIRVVYVAGASVYVDAGTADGLGPGDSLVVRRLGSEIALLRVSDLSTRRAACETLLVRVPVAVGDEVRRVGVIRPAAPPVAAADPAGGAIAAADSLLEPIARPVPEARRAGRPWLRGRAGARWMSASAAGSVRVRQPMLDVHAEAGTATSPASATLDVRGRRTLRTSAAGLTSHDAEARVYRASVTWRRADERVTASAGRIASPALATVSLFDGALVETGTPRWRAGAFGGTQPDPAHMRWSSRVTEYGAFVETRARADAARRWQAEVGAVSSYDDGRSNRDFLFGQGFYQDPRVSGSWLQEADVMRPWKRVTGEKGFAFTSTFVTAQARLPHGLALQSGYDSRRNVRLWRDRVTPETEFDDRYRQGVWAGATARFAGGVTLAGDQRWNRGGENATVSNGSLELRPRHRLAPSLRGRWSEYRSSASTSRLLAASLGFQPAEFAWLEASGGERRTAPAGGPGDPPVRWWGTSADLTFGRRWFADFSWEASRSALENTSQIYAGLSRRL